MKRTNFFTALCFLFCVLALGRSEAQGDDVCRASYGGCTASCSDCRAPGFCEFFSSCFSCNSCYSPNFYSSCYGNNCFYDPCFCCVSSMSYFVNLEGAVGETPFRESDTVWRLRLFDVSRIYDLCTGLYTVFYDVSAAYLEKEDWTASIGTGMRFSPNKAPIFYGGNVYYDYRHTKFGSFHQVGLGVEVLSCLFDVRGNVFLPIGKRHKDGDTIVFDNYVGNYQVTAQERYISATGYNFEVGKGFGFCDLRFYFAVGGYGLHFHGGEDLFGVMARLRAEGWYNTYVEGAIYYDDVFETTGEIRFGIVQPICGGCERLCGPRSLVYRGGAADGGVNTIKCCKYETNY